MDIMADPPNYILHATAISATVPFACMTEMSKMSVTNTITLTVESVSLVALTNQRFPLVFICFDHGHNTDKWNGLVPPETSQWLSTET